MKQRVMKNRLRTLLGGLLTTALSLSANAQDARVQVIHNAADVNADSVDVWIDNAKALSKFAFRQATPFLSLPAGTHQIRIKAKNSTDTTSPLFRTTVSLAPGERYVVVANGVLDPAQYAANPEGRDRAFDLLVINPGRETAATAGQTSVNILHGATDAPAVLVRARGVATLVNGAAYRDNTGYLNLPASNYTLDVYPASGTAPVASFTAPLSAFADSALTVLASGFLNPAANQNGAAFGLLAVTAGGQTILLPGAPALQPARLQVIHNAADVAADSVDVWLNNTLLLDNFAFRTATPFIDAPADLPFQLRVKAKNSADTISPLFRTTVSLAPGERYVVVANGVLDPAQYAANPSSASTAFNLFVRPAAREVSTTAGAVDLQVFHGATDAPAVDVVVNGTSTTLVDNITYGTFQGYLNAAAAAIRLNVTTADQSAIVQTVDVPLNLFSDSALTVVASGFLNPAANQTGEGFRLIAVTAAGRAIPLPIVTAPAQTARVQVIHNAADVNADSVDVWIDNTKALSKFAFRKATPFLDLPAGIHQIRIKAKNSADTANPLFYRSYNLVANERYILVANGVLNPAQYAANPEGRDRAFDLLVINPGRETAATAGQTSVNILHGATDAPAVLVRARGVATLVNGAAYRDNTGYLNLTATNYVADVYPANGTTPVASFTAPLAGFADSAVVVLASGFLNPAANQNGAAFGLLAVTAGGQALLLPAAPALQPARLQVIHNAADVAAASVDVWLNNNLLLDNFAFRTATPFIDAPSDLPFQLRVKAGNSTDTTSPLFRTTISLAPGERYVVVANGVLNPAQYAANPGGASTAFNLFVRAAAREVSTTPGAVDVQVFHGATDAPAVDAVDVASTFTLVDNLSYGNFDGYLTAAASAARLNITTADQTVVVQTVDVPLGIFADSALTVVASGFLNPANNQNGQAFRLVAVTPKGRAILLPVVVSVKGLAGIERTRTYPNPARERIFVSGPVASLDNRYELINLQGRSVGNLRATLVNNETIELLPEGVTSGTYLLRISNPAGEYSTVKIVVE